MTDWKRKLAAYLHDPPSKALDIRTHGERSDAAFRQAGFTDENDIGSYFRQADHAGAAADRLPFPHSQAANLVCAFDGVRNSFIHPLSGARLPYHAEFKSAEQGIEGESSVQPRLAEEALARLPDEDSRWRARFFAHWRLWPKHASEHDYRFALLPADTRIPDHSIWTHMQVVSALDGCRNQDGQWRPAFLKFQLGPVQDFIAAARSIRDLWSGSYLLSWLMAAGLKKASAEVGPDAVVFPNLRGQPLFDLHWRAELWSQVRIGDQTVWDSLGWQNRALLTPNLPNVFLAIVPQDRAAALGREIAEAIQSEWARIAEAVWSECERAGLSADEGAISATRRRARFDAQIARFLALSWQATPWPETLADALRLSEDFAADLPIQAARQRVEAVIAMATRQMPVKDRDGRFYAGGGTGAKTELNNVGLGWSIILAFNSWALDAVRQTRPFAASSAGGWEVGVFNNKDALTGRDEAVAGGEQWGERAEAAGGYWPALFKKSDWLGASTLVKRVWHRAYLERVWGLKTDARGFPMPNTRGLAAHQPEVDCSDDETSEEAAPSEKYFAVLAFDGDEIGRWVSGEKTPPFASQLADYTDGSHAERLGARRYFERSEFSEFLQAQRPLSPSYHLQFSEALSNFALWCARPVVEAFHGRLIYAGGDDVVALLPADNALACAEALRRAFTGQEVAGPGGSVLFRSLAPGFLATEKWKDDHGRGRPIPVVVPGPKADASVGIAMAHFKSPLQDVVRAAQLAEKRAKTQLNRAAVAITLCKRSGETIEWGCRWADGGTDLYRALDKALGKAQLSSKFPYRVIELLEPYLLQPTGLARSSAAAEFELVAGEVIQREFAAVCDRQRGTAWSPEVPAHLLPLLRAYVAHSGNAEQALRAVIGLCQTVAFANRTRSEAGSEPPAERQPA